MFDQIVMDCIFFFFTLARNYNQWTPLDLAASKGWTKTCCVLLEEDAPVDPTDKNKVDYLMDSCYIYVKCDLF